MNKTKDIHTKKSLVRNSEKSLPRYEVDPHPVVSKDIGGITIKSSETTKNSKNKFDSPELYSSLKLSQQIDKLVKPRKTKSCSDVVDKKYAVDEKISRRVNFPYSQPIYKDLIPLTCSQIPHQPVVASREPFLQKDKEPLLSDFVIPKSIPNHYSLPSVKVEIKSTLIGNNNLRLYNHLGID